MNAANDNDRCCPMCNVAITGRPSKVYCSALCKRRAKENRKAPHSERRLMHVVCVCEGCSVEFNPKNLNRLRFCSRECFFATIAAEAEERASNRPVVSEYDAFLASIKFSECSHCAHEFVTLSRTAAYCSDECRTTATRIKSRDAWRAMAASKANDNELKPARDCSECGCEFTPIYGDKRSVYCSRECSKRSSRRIARKAARARLKLALVDRVNPTKVFERDQWTCMQCGIATPRELRGTYEPSAPELDHIMPLSKGGEHSYANTQCLCRKCNANKSDSLPLAA